MALSLYDTETAAVRPFLPRVAGEVGIYLCGATVQSAPHIGHVRSAVAFDVLRRWLEYSGHRVTLIRNVTDIDDKILARAAATGRPWWSIAYDNEQAFNAAYDALNVLRPTYEPRATGHVPEMITMITELVDGGHAYAAPDGSGDVYFDVLSWPDYGELTHQRVTDMEPAPDADPRGKRDPRDFALWKGHKPGEPTSAAWPTPWGAGRPGWHLECSAMARKYLGPAFDIHAGGIDLRFPHHENELAQSRAAKDDFAAYWLHNAWVTAGGDKMSKSLGNGLGVPEVLQRVRPAELRYYLGSVGYRSTIEFSEHALEDAAAAYRRIESFLARATGLGQRSEGGRPTEAESSALPSGFTAALDDDLGVARAVGVVHDHVREGNRALEAGDRRAGAAAVAAVRTMTRILGIDPTDFPAPAMHSVTQSSTFGSAVGASTEDPAARAVRVLVEPLLEERATARRDRDFTAADAVRDRLTAAGVVLADGVLQADGTRRTTWSLAAEAPDDTQPLFLEHLVADSRPRKAAIRKTPKKGTSVGSGGQRRRQLEGRGPTPAAEQREHHPAARRAAAASRSAQGSGGSRSGASRSGGLRPAAGRGGAPRSGAPRPGAPRPAGGRPAGGRASGTGRAPAPRRGNRDAAEIVAGRNAVLEALSAGIVADTVYIAERIETDDRVRTILKLCTQRRLPILESPRAELDRLTGDAVHQGVALAVKPYEYREVADLLEAAAGVTAPVVVALDGVLDPHNVGAVARSAAAFGAVGLLLPERRSAGVTAGAWKASAGAFARLPVARVTNLTRALGEFAEAGWTILGLAGEGGQDLAGLATSLPAALDGPLVIVGGAEAKGLSRLTRERCDVLVRVPIAASVESLNVSVATAIALYELRRASTG